MKPPATPLQHESVPLEGVVLISEDGTVSHSNSRTWELLESNYFREKTGCPRLFESFTRSSFSQGNVSRPITFAASRRERNCL